MSGQIPARVVGSAAFGERPAEPGFQCDFCGDRVPSVSRVALDGDYERLRTRHRVRYACPSCSDKKERQRVGIERG